MVTSTLQSTTADLTDIVWNLRCPPSLQPLCTIRAACHHRNCLCLSPNSNDWASAVKIVDTNHANLNAICWNPAPQRLEQLRSLIVRRSGLSQQPFSYSCFVGTRNEIHPILPPSVSSLVKPVYAPSPIQLLQRISVQLLTFCDRALRIYRWS